jgi:hypothetical protein
MNYPITLEGFEGQALEVRSAGVLKGVTLLINGQPAAKGRKRGEMVLRRNDGREVAAAWKPQLLGLDVPQLSVDGKTFSVTPPLAWYVLVWSALPLLLIILGGAMGALAGMIGFSVNAGIFRSSRSTVTKFALSAVVSLATVLIYLVAVSLLLAALGR